MPQLGVLNHSWLRATMNILVPWPKTRSIIESNDVKWGNPLRIHETLCFKKANALLALNTINCTYGIRALSAHVYQWRVRNRHDSDEENDYSTTNLPLWTLTQDTPLCYQWDSNDYWLQPAMGFEPRSWMLWGDVWNISPSSIQIPRSFREPSWPPHPYLADSLTIFSADFRALGSIGNRDPNTWVRMLINNGWIMVNNVYLIYFNIS